jgi:hypothetical protein
MSKGIEARWRNLAQETSVRKSGGHMIDFILKLFSAVFIVLEIVMTPFELRAMRAKRRAQIEAMDQAKPGRGW